MKSTASQKAKRSARRVAIACQGGGSHTAFTAGALKGLLRGQRSKGFEVVALSGTSGGASCALLAWYGLVNRAGRSPDDLLDAFWKGVTAHVSEELLTAPWFWSSRLCDSISCCDVEVNLPQHPYFRHWSCWEQDRLRSLLEDLVDFGSLDPARLASEPLLLVGAIELLTGRFQVFSSVPDTSKKELPVSADAVLASCAVPTLFPPVRTQGGVFWDGILSQNPPIRELLRARPDEIWIVQINPIERETEPQTVGETKDRRNELAANLSLEQEKHFVRTINRMIRAGMLSPKGLKKYKPVACKTIEMPAEVSRNLDFCSKLDRSEFFIQTLLEEGEARADRFLRKELDLPGEA